MSVDSSFSRLQHLLEQLHQTLPQQPNRDLLLAALQAIAEISALETDRLNWKLIAGSLQDMQKAVALFQPYRHVRKVSVFGSARTHATAPEYEQAKHFAQCIVNRGFLVLTGGGGGIMEAGNAGAGSDQSFALNIALPFEQVANPFAGDRLVHFKYFFTRKLFFMRESDAVALFPGGFGTQDEFFECLTLCQTGKATPRPVILVDKPGGDYWVQWDAYIQKHLLGRGLISPQDRSLYTITDDIQVACKAICQFYRVFHSSRWVDDRFVIRLNCPLTETHLAQLNREFGDILTEGAIAQTNALPKEQSEPKLQHLPRLVLHFNQMSYGRLQELIWAINDVPGDGAMPFHPETK
jgi:uncharacterized protein (TIGR00730 family)